MTPEQFQRVQAAFLAARALPAGARAGFLDIECGGDPALRAEVEALLARDGPTEGVGLLDVPAVGLGAEALDALLPQARACPADAGRTSTEATGADPSSAGRRQRPGTSTGALPAWVGSYRILGLLGEGGMGAVYRAEQRHPRRPVALKVVRPGLLSPRLRRRFELEAEVLGRLEHPGIAHIYEAGTADAGRGVPQPFFAMELVEGRPLTDHARARRLNTAARLDLLARVCDAVQHAHQRGVVHRDLKPSNILVTEDGQPKVVDFGVARALDADVQGAAAAAATGHTEAGQVVGTLHYMSPEQAGGEAHAVDTRSDVYALGVVAYELLADRLPYTLAGRPLHEAVRAIREEEPDRLSSATGDRALRGDVETIVAKALAKEPARRYATAAELAADLRRHLNAEPIAARPPGTWYQLSKFARRNRAATVGAAATLAVLVAGVAVSAVFAVRATRASSDARTQRNTAVAAKTAADDQARLATAAATRERQVRLQLQGQQAALVSARDAAEQNRLAAELRLAEGLVAQGDAQALANRARDAFTSYAKARDTFVGAGASPEPASLGRWQALRLWSLPLGSFAGHREVVHAVEWLPDGRTVVSAAHDRTIKLWDVVAGRELRTLRGHEGGLASIACSSDGKLLLSGGLKPDPTVRLWDLGNDGGGGGPGRGRVLVGHTDDVNGVAFVPPANRFAVSAGGDRTVRLWDLATGATVRTFAGHTDRLDCVATSADGKLVISGGRDATARIWDLASGKQVRLLPHASWVAGAAFFDDDRQVVTTSTDHALRVWEVGSGRLVRVMRGHSHGVWDVDVTPTGDTAVSVSEDGTMRTWDLKTGEPLRTFANPGSSPWIRCVAVSPDGRTAVTGDGDGGEAMVRTWSLKETLGARQLRAGEGDLLVAPSRSQDGHGFALSTSPVAPLAATAAVENRVTLWDLPTGKPLRILDGHGGLVRTVAFSRSGQQLVSGGNDKAAILWDVGTGRVLQTLEVGPGGVSSAAVSTDGSLLLTSDHTRLRVWEAATGRQRSAWKTHRGGYSITQLAISPDARHAFTSSYDATIRMWDLATGAECQVFGGHRQWMRGLALSRDGTLIVSANDDRRIKVWRVGGPEIREMNGHAAHIYCVAATPDGSRVLSGSEDRTVRLWDVASGRELRTIHGHASGVRGVAFTPDTSAFVSVDWFGQMMHWDLSTPHACDRFARAFGNAAGAPASTGPLDATAKQWLGEWYAFRGVNEWAVELLRDARAGGADVSPLLLGRCLWRAGRGREAAAEFRKALARGEAPDYYLIMCVVAAEQEASGGGIPRSVASAADLASGPAALAESVAGPFGGKPVSVPGTVQAEDFDRGGEGVGYHEVTPESIAATDRTYRPAAAVDINAPADGGPGRNVGGVWAGEWLAYTLDVREAGDYDVRLRLASPTGGGTLHLLAGGRPVTGPVAVPNTGHWLAYNTVTRRGVRLAKGTQVLRVVFDAAAADRRKVGTNTDSVFVCNIDWFEIRRAQDPAGHHPDRAAAEWVIDRGGAVRLANPAEPAAPTAAGDWVRRVRDLPAGPFTVAEVNLGRAEPAGDDLGPVAGLKGLSHLDLGWRDHVRRAGLRRFRGSTTLRRLGLLSNRVTDELIADVATMPNLEWLSLGRCDLTDDMCRRLAPLGRLTELSISDNRRLSNAGLAAVCRLEALTRLHATGMDFWDARSAGLVSGLKRLQFLSVAVSNIDDEMLGHLHIPTLRELHLQKTRVTADGVRRFQARHPKCKVHWDAGAVKS